MKYKIEIQYKHATPRMLPPFKKLITSHNQELPFTTVSWSWNNDLK